MDDETNVSESTATIEPPKRRRGRPRRVPTDTLLTVDEGQEKPRRTRRSAKLKGDDIVNLVTKGCGYYAGLSGREHWNVAPDEVKPWSDDAAELLNKLPAKYIRGAVDFSGYLTVAIGIATTFGPRIMFDRALAAQAKSERSQNGHVPDPDKEPGQTPVDSVWQGN